MLATTEGYIERPQQFVEDYTDKKNYYFQKLSFETLDIQLHLVPLYFGLMKL